MCSYRFRQYGIIIIIIMIDLFTEHEYYTFPVGGGEKYDESRSFAGNACSSDLRANTAESITFYSLPSIKQSFSTHYLPYQPVVYYSSFHPASKTNIAILQSLVFPQQFFLFRSNGRVLHARSTNKPNYFVCRGKIHPRVTDDHHLSR